MTFFTNFLLNVKQLVLTSHCLHLAILGDMNADLLVPSLSQTKLLLSVMRQFQLVDLVCKPTRVTMSSSSQIDVLLTTDVQCFESTEVFPFSGSDHHIIISHFYASGICVDPQPHRFVISFLAVMIFGMRYLPLLMMCLTVWSDYDWAVGPTSPA